MRSLLLRHRLTLRNRLLYLRLTVKFTGIRRPLSLGTLLCLSLGHWLCLRLNGLRSSLLNRRLRLSLRSSLLNRRLWLSLWSGLLRFVVEVNRVG